MSFGHCVTLAQCATNAYNALVKRHLAPPQNRVTMKLINPFLKSREFKARMRAAMDAAQLSNTNDEWRLGKSLVKLKQIDKSKAFDKLEPHKSKAFVKFEVSTKVPTKARLIQGNQNERTAYDKADQYAAMGGAMKDAGSEWFEYGGVRWRLHYAGGMNHNDLSDEFTRAWEEAGLWRILDERDGKNWDSTMQEETLREEARVYEMLKLPVVLDFLRRCSAVDGSVKTKSGNVKYTTAWKRLSGDWNTSVGNTIISMIVCFSSILALPEHLRPRSVEAFFMGDDYLGVYSFRESVDPSALHQALNHYESKCGITPERGIFDDPLFVTFISLGVWPRRGGGYQFVPQPAKQMVKLFCTTCRLTPKQIAQYNNGICKGFWLTYRGLDVMLKFLKHHYTPGVKDRGLDWYHIAQALTKEDRQVDWRLGFGRKYGMPYTSLSFDPAVTHGGIVRHPVIDEMLRLESLDPADRQQCLYRPNKN